MRPFRGHSVGVCACLRAPRGAQPRRSAVRSPKLQASSAKLANRMQSSCLRLLLLFALVFALGAASLWLLASPVDAFEAPSSNFEARSLQLQASNWPPNVNRDDELQTEQIDCTSRAQIVCFHADIVTHRVYFVSYSLPVATVALAVIKYANSRATRVALYRISAPIIDHHHRSEAIGFRAQPVGAQLVSNLRFRSLGARLAESRVPTQTRRLF